jgi:LuxR family maltose regulon positive regulatory protein
MPLDPAWRTAGPALPQLFVPRPRLLAALADGGAHPVLLCAPPGFGKTTLLAHWARRTTDADGIVWVDLGAGGEPTIWPAVVAALRSCPWIPADSTLHDLDPGGAAPSAAAIAEILQTLDTLPVRIALILHDVHEVVAPMALRQLWSLLDARPAGVHLVLSSRWDIPVPPGRRRSAGRLHEVRGDQLCFSREETVEFLRRADLDLDPAHVRELQACTGGWPAGVRLASAVLRGGADPGGFLKRFAAAGAPIADFLVGDVLAALPAADRDLLAAIGTGEPVTGPLAAVLSRRGDAGQALERLVQESGLVERQPGERFRVHPLVAPHLRPEQPARGESAAQGRDRAARWGEAQDDPIAAIRHAVRVDDVALLAALVHRFAGRLLVTGNHPLLSRVLSRIGRRAVTADPWLTLCGALTRIEAGMPVAADIPADDPADPVAEGAASGAAVRLAVLRSITSVFGAASSADLGTAPDRVDLGRSRRESPEWTGLALVGAGGRAMLVEADIPAAAEAFDEALELARANGFGYLEMQCLGLLGSIAGIDGDYSTMVTAATGADAVAVAGGWETSPLATAARWMLAYGALLRSEPGAAYRLAGEALCRGGPLLRPRYACALRTVQGAALFDLGQHDRGLREMQRARAALGETRLSHEQAAVLGVLEHRAAAALGWSESADAVVAWLASRIGARAEVLLMRALAEHAAGRDRAAMAMVRPVLDGTVAPVLPYTAVEALLLEADIGVSAGDIRGARGALQDALSSGASLGVVRPFTTAGGPVRELLADHLVRGGTREPFVVRALAVSRRPNTRTAPLDDVELSILARLPSSSSVVQIAGELGIGSEEARSRVRAVYRKLGVSSRRTAVSVAYERGLLR